MKKKLFPVLLAALMLAIPGCSIYCPPTRDLSGNDGQVDPLAQKGTIIVAASPQNGGIVSGGGTYDWRSRITIKATPANGWKFVRWQDGNTSATRVITVPRGTITYTATFSNTASGTVNTKADPPEGGSVSGGGMYPIGQVITINATPNPEWKFVRWQDGNTNTPLTFVVPSGTFSITAYFATNIIAYGNLVVRGEPPAGGTVNGAGTFPVGSIATIQAMPNPNWTFTQWQDGRTENPRTVTMPTGTVFMVASFLTNQPAFGNVNVVVSPAQGGSVSGAGSYPVGTSVTLSAVPNSGWRFSNWEDNSTNVNRSVFVQAGEFTATAFFQQFGTISLVSEPPWGGTTTGAGTYPAGSIVEIAANSAHNWSFVRWQDGNVSALRGVTVQPGTTLMTATFQTNAPAQGTIACDASPPTGGTIAGCGTFNAGQTVTILAQPFANWRFVQWADGLTTASRSVMVPTNGTSVQTATFEQFGNVTVVAEPSNGGTISGSGSYAVGQSVTVTATPSANWSFQRWQDGNTNLSRQISVGPGNLIMTGTFATNAVPQPGSAKINWVPSSLSPDAKTFLVKWGTSPGNYTSVLTTNATSISIPGLNTNQLYYFAVQARSTNGLVSLLSCEVAWRYPNIVSCGL